MTLCFLDIFAVPSEVELYLQEHEKIEAPGMTVAHPRACHTVANLG